MPSIRPDQPLTPPPDALAAERPGANARGALTPPPDALAIHRVPVVGGLSAAYAREEVGGPAKHFCADPGEGRG